MNHFGSFLKLVFAGISIGVIVGLAGCNYPVSATLVTSTQNNSQSQPLTPTPTAVSITPLVVLASVTSEPAAGYPPQFTSTPIPQDQSNLSNTTPSVTSTTSIPCDRAIPGNPIDITIPDDSEFTPGENFTKTWRLVNFGTCTWTREYTLVWFSGDPLGASTVMHLNNTVPPGQQVDISIDMTAPTGPGSYQSNWKLRNADGQLFGIGPTGHSPFWVRILVIEADTPTPDVPVFATPTQVASITGDAVLAINESLDLDTIEKTTEGTADLNLVEDENGSINIEPANSARMVDFGMTEPTFVNCLNASTTQAGFQLTETNIGSFICYRTNMGLPGWFEVLSWDAANKQVELKIHTWITP